MYFLLSRFSSNKSLGMEPSRDDRYSMQVCITSIVAVGEILKNLFNILIILLSLNLFFFLNLMNMELYMLYANSISPSFFGCTSELLALLYIINLVNRVVKSYTLITLLRNCGVLTRCFMFLTISFLESTITYHVFVFNFLFLSPEPQAWGIVSL